VKKHLYPEKPFRVTFLDSGAIHRLNHRTFTSFLSLSKAAYSNDCNATANVEMLTRCPCIILETIVGLSGDDSRCSALRVLDHPLI